MTPEAFEAAMFDQQDAEGASTRHCHCGALFQWSGFDDRLSVWMAEHRPHVAQGYRQTRHREDPRALRARVAELEAACRCGAQALRLHDEASPTAPELEAAAEDRPSVYRAGNSSPGEGPGIGQTKPI